MISSKCIKLLAVARDFLGLGKKDKKILFAKVMKMVDGM